VNLRRLRRQAFLSEHFCQETVKRITDSRFHTVNLPPIMRLALFADYFCQ
jgi:hypothetical protein